MFILLLTIIHVAVEDIVALLVCDLSVKQKFAAEWSQVQIRFDDMGDLLTEVCGVAFAYFPKRIT